MAGFLEREIQEKEFQEHFGRPSKIIFKSGKEVLGIPENIKESFMNIIPLKNYKARETINTSDISSIYSESLIIIEKK